MEKKYKIAPVIVGRIDLYDFEEEENGLALFIEFLQKKLKELQTQYPEHSIEIETDYWSSDDPKYNIVASKRVSETEYYNYRKEKQKEAEEKLEKLEYENFLKLKQKYEQL